MHYINTKKQLADILTKGSFTAQVWLVLLSLFQIGSKGVRITPNAGSSVTEAQKNHAVAKARHKPESIRPYKGTAQAGADIPLKGYMNARIVPACGATSINLKKDCVTDSGVALLCRSKEDERYSTFTFGDDGTEMKNPIVSTSSPEMVFMRHRVGCECICISTYLSAAIFAVLE